MENVNLPTEKAQEPAEEACQPICMSGSTMGSQEGNKPKKRATFADDAMPSENAPSQSSSAYKEVLSQPPDTLSHRQRLLWLQRRRGPGLWVQCDACNAWRHLPDIVDSHQLPHKWYCTMNPDKSKANCKASEVPLRITDEEDLIHSEYSCGSLVWARLAGWPWWPAMVDDCPDTEQFYWLDGFSDIPTHYNVVFFDTSDATRAWISPENLKPYTANKKKFRHLLNSKQYKKRLEKALKEADKAEKLSVTDRLAKYSFLTTFKGPIVSPKKVSKRELERFQTKLKRKYNVDFPIEDTSESDEELVQAFREKNKRNNVIIIGTPTSKKTKHNTTKKDHDNTVKEPGQKKHSENDKNDKRDSDKNDKRDSDKNDNRDNDKNDKRDNDVKERNNTKEPLKRKTRHITNDLENAAAGKNENVFTAVSTATTETCEQSFKLPDSMAIQIGSTQSFKQHSQPETNGFDNDSSKTYAPEEEYDSVVITQDFNVRVASPSSDDFDF